MGEAPMGPPPPAEGSALSSPEDGSNLDFLRDAIESVRGYMEGEDDDMNIAKAAKMLAGLQEILANEQKLSESALGVSPQSKFLSKNSGSSGGPY